MNTKKEKGDIGLSKAIASLVLQKIHVSIPISEDLKYDLLGEKDGIIKRVQVRFSTPVNDILPVKLKSSWSNRQGVHINKRKQGDFDILAVYCPKNDNVYFVDDSEFTNTTSINIRLKDRKQRNQHPARFAEDFIDCTRYFN